MIFMPRDHGMYLVQETAKARETNSSTKHDNEEVTVTPKEF